MKHTYCVGGMQNLWVLNMAVHKASTGLSRVELMNTVSE